jgi:hypothetical protein
MRFPRVGSSPAIVDMFLELLETSFFGVYRTYSTVHAVHDNAANSSILIQLLLLMC